MADTQVKIILITGYLGAGKTTLLNNILKNQQGIRAAVIVNDIGEVNVDVALIDNSGFSQMEGELIPLTNGCLCCTLSDDLAKQLESISDSGKFDYIIIEASGICEPIPIAYVISDFCDARNYEGKPPLALDNIVAVVDCARMYDEFNGGMALLEENIDEDDVESLLIQQIEFCSTLVLNKTDLVEPEQVSELRAIVRSLQRDAVIVEAENSAVPLAELLDTGRFDFEKAYSSAAWMEAMEHPEEHEDPEVLEYDIDTFVYKRRAPFDLDKLNEFAEDWPESIIRAKGIVWCTEKPESCFVFEQAGRQMSFEESSYWVATAPEDERQQALSEYPEIAEDWDPICGDRMVKICFIGRHMDKQALIDGLDACLVDFEG